jgi:hypothetical protein
MTPTLEHLADLALAATSHEAAHGKATSALASAQAARDAVASRLAQAQQRQREIGGRRAEGDVRDDDVQELAVLAADISGLQDLLSRRDAEVEAARAAVAPTAAALSTAKFQLARAEAQALEAGLLSRAEEAARVLTEALQQLRKVRDTSLGGGLVPFAVSDALWTALVQIRHLRPWGS